MSRSLRNRAQEAIFVTFTQAELELCGVRGVSHCPGWQEKGMQPGRGELAQDVAGALSHAGPEPQLLVAA
jgi:hypothetical protein